MFLFSQLPSITGGKLIQLAGDRPITYLVIDSRKALYADESLFFAIAGHRHDGHQFIEHLYKAGIRQFVIERDINPTAYPLANFIRVSSTVAALQALATAHRQQFDIPVVGVTGSNGKTVIKEWLYQLLSPDLSIIKNPGSYNSQVGVPLSVWAMQAHHQLGIFEAGISQAGEMQLLAPVIAPTIGLISNIGAAHDEGFRDRTEKADEKLKLFATAGVIIYCQDYELLHERITQTYAGKTLIGWGAKSNASVQVTRLPNASSVVWKGQLLQFNLPHTDFASVENLHHCIVLLLHMGISPEVIQQRIVLLKGVSMRMEMKQGINNCLLIDDTYNNDLGGLKISLDFLAGQQREKKKTIILSDIFQSGLAAEQWIAEVRDLISKAGLHSVILVGPEFSSHSSLWSNTAAEVRFFESAEELMEQYSRDYFRDEAILIKGARPFRLERIVHWLQKKVHGTVMEIDLGAMVHNLNFFKSRLHRGVKLMAMVKAFAYGSGSAEVATLLQYHRVDYLGVAYADEGVELRKNHIRLPIMVMNPSTETFSFLLEYQLEPEIYSLRMLYALVDFLNGRSITVHIKIETGMNRLGLNEQDLAIAAHVLQQNANIKVASVFSHLAGADEPEHDDYSHQQAQSFQRLSDLLIQSLPQQQQPLRHLLNTPGILRFPQMQYDMVRLGIGLYGLDPTQELDNALQPVAALKSVISQIKELPADATVGYGRKGTAKVATRIATIAIGYADGFNRAFSQGKGHVWINGSKAPVIGNVCMDMTMIDITGIEAQEGDEVIIFGKELPIREVAQSIGTIPYEILTNTSERVKRVFWSEGM